MNRFKEMKVFTQVVEMNSFGKVAQAWIQSDSSIRDVIKRCENRLGVNLLDHSEKTVTPALDGQVWYRKCQHIISELEATEASFQGTLPRGRLRIDVQVSLARYYLLPQLSKFLHKYPGFELQLSKEVHLARLGKPDSLDDLAENHVIGLLSLQNDGVQALNFMLEHQEVERIVASTFSASSTDTMLIVARLGMGLIQALHFQLASAFTSGRLLGGMVESGV